ncbi:MAG TPA: site-specific integrase, partial [Gammaproteobacteria bacterium]|nr:site-specific integrase [Gammaproteobacteria bacterium]
EDDMEAGIWGTVSARQHRPLREALDWYRDNVSCHRMGAASERYRLQCLRDELGAILIAQLDAPRIVAYVRRRLEHVCGDTLRRELGLLSDALNTVQVEWGFTLPVNPVMAARPLLRKMRAMATHPGRTRRLKPGELEALLAAPHTQPTLIGAIIEFAVETAMRRGEIAALRHTDIHWTQGTLTIRHSKTDWKTHTRGREIPLSPRALEILREVPERADGSVFGLTDPHSITQAFKRTIDLVNREAAVGRAGFVEIEGLRFHDLRHEATSRLFERGFEIQEVAVFTGHRDWKSLRRYTHIDPARLAQTLAASPAPKLRVVG